MAIRLIDTLRGGPWRPAQSAQSTPAHPPVAVPMHPPGTPHAPTAEPSRGDGWTVDLERRREQLTARVAELQWDLGGLFYEMEIRDRIRLEVLIKRAAALQDVDAELGEVERILRMEKSGVSGACGACDAPHSSGAVYCWQCGQPLLEQVPSHAIGSAAKYPARAAASPPLASSPSLDG